MPYPDRKEQALPISRDEKDPPLLDSHTPGIQKWVLSLFGPG